MLLNYIINLLKQIKRKLIPIRSNSPSIINNVFKSTHRKRVLLSYFIDPFINGIKYSHTNYLECYTAAEIFHNLGYKVDVVNLDYRGNLNYHEYEVVYGMGEVLEKSFYTSYNTDTKKIFYATGCCPTYSNNQTVKKIIDFNKKTKYLIPESGRIIGFTTGLQENMSDSIIVLGNKDVLKTYPPKEQSHYKRNNINCFFIDSYDVDIQKKNFNKIKKNFIWFGSSGLLHKGLDVVLNVFLMRDDVKLYICGASSEEKGFWDYYKHLIDNKTNIINCGFVNIFSDHFKELMDNSIAVIHPSVSEGGAAAVLNVMANGGLIPIISKMTGLDIGNLGYYIENYTEDEINSSIDSILTMNDEELFEIALKVKNHTRQNYSYNSYKKNLEYYISQSI